MNLRNTLTSFVVFFALTVFSQNDFIIGLSAGSNYSSIWNNESSTNSNSDFGYLFGISFEYYLKENLSITSGINFERKATTVNSIRGDVDKEDDKYDYFILPLLLKYDFGKSRKNFLNVGTFFGFLQNRFLGDLEISSRTNKNFDFGLVIGIGRKIILNNKNTISFELRNNLGLINVLNNEKNRQFGISDIILKTNSINLNLNWSLKI